jgi:Tol biopolymer transport system component
MKNTIWKCAFGLVVLLLFSACTSTKEVVVNYQMVSVPEEGGIRFVQLTREGEKIAGPNVIKADKLYWYTGAMIDVSEDGSTLSHLAFDNQKLNVYLKKTAGGRATTQRTFREDVKDMAFSPDGDWIAFSETRGGDQNIHLINAKEGAAIQQITTTPSDESGPSFSPDSRYIFFTRTERTRLSDNSTLTRNYVWSFDRNTSLFTQYGEGFNPTVTPDGEKMLVTRTNKDTRRGEIWMMNLKTGQETLLLSDSKKGFSSPHVSPDGKKVVCVGTTLGTPTVPVNLDIYKFNIDGTQLTQLTFHGGYDVSPRWGPDGQSVYFISQRGNEKGDWNVWKMEI